MIRPPNVVTGMRFGKLIVRRKLLDATSGSANTRKRWAMECECGTKEIIPEYYLLRAGNPRRDCGCSRKTNKTIFNEEYRIWLMMHVRTENNTHVAYESYGGRGIKVCAEWHRDSPDGKGFDRFLAFIGPRPSPQHSVDRINNDQGYQPEFEGKPQVKWSTAVEQRANQRPRRVA